jgi:hypothetical protein
MVVIRSFFWWGHFFSSTLQLSGAHQHYHITAISDSYEMLKEMDYSICINDDPWEHHFEKDNYMAIASFTKTAFDELIRQHRFIKISRKIDLRHWSNAVELLTADFRQLIQVLAI